MADRIDFANLIWQIADLLRGPWRPPQYERVMLPLTVPAPTKAKVLAEYERLKPSLGGSAADDAPSPLTDSVHKTKQLLKTGERARVDGWLEARGL